MRGIGILVGTSHSVRYIERFVISRFVISRADCNSDFQSNFDKFPIFALFLRIKRELGRRKVYDK
jgi:hypothetical protein